jgi:hypothetical protein
VNSFEVMYYNQITCNWTFSIQGEVRTTLLIR